MTSLPLALSTIVVPWALKVNVESIEFNQIFHRRTKRNDLEYLEGAWLVNRLGFQNAKLARCLQKAQTTRA